MQRAGDDTPELTIEAPAELAGARTRLESFDTGRLRGVMQLVGLDAARDPIRVVLAPEGSPLARQAQQPVAGFASLDENLIVLFLHARRHILTTRSRTYCTTRWRTY